MTRKKEIPSQELTALGENPNGARLWCRGKGSGWLGTCAKPGMETVHCARVSRTQTIRIEH